jgi:hypothetical protein
MTRHETELNGAQVNTAPLFASVWLALFSSLWENYNERRLLATGLDTDCPEETEDN